MLTMAKVLVVDDEKSLLEVLTAAIAREGHDVSATTNPEEATAIIREGGVDALITDLRMEPIDGIALLKEAKQADSEIVVIMITAYASVQTAIEAMKEGAYDYIIKPFNLDDMRMTLNRGLAHRGLAMENMTLKRELAGLYRFENIVGVSDAMMNVFRMIEKIADTESTVLIYGESGTGKELVARAIHYNSSRAPKPFVAVSCGALPESLLESELFGHVKGAFTGAIASKDGLFKAADGGTIFLDEVGATSPAIQASLLRVLQEREVKPVGAVKNIKVTCRVIAASNEKLEDKVKEGTFREDLFYRLSVIPIDIPPLRERREDIPVLAEHFLRRSLERLGNDRRLRFSREALEKLVGYDWPGNVRELENAIERVVTMSDGGLITVEDLPEKILEQQSVKNLKEFVRQKERAYIERILRETEGDKKEAAKILGIDLATLYRKIDRLKMQKGE